MKDFINIRGVLFDLSIPRVMGIVNVTPDSFYDRSRTFTEGEIAQKVDSMVSEGADIIDVGGYSSRPRATEISVEEEISRISMALELIRKRFDNIIISVDTFRSEVAKVAVNDYGVDMINDISGGEMDKRMFGFVAAANIPYIMMHMQGTPANMQDSPLYDNVVSDIVGWFSQRLEKLTDMGVKDIIIDPGFGFGKSIEHNYEMLHDLDEFGLFGLPVMVGLSRKSMIWKELGIDPGNSLAGTITLNTIALMKGASILRVHDVREAVQSVKLFRKIHETPAQ